jgi:hypothetical protein
MILTQFHALTILKIYFLMIHLNVILPLLLGPPSGCFPRDFLSKIVWISCLPHAWVTCPAYQSLLIFTTLTISGLYKSQCPLLCNILNCPLTPYLLGWNVFLSPFFSNIYNLYPSQQTMFHNLPQQLEKLFYAPWSSIFWEVTPTIWDAPY